MLLYRDSSSHLPQNIRDGTKLPRLVPRGAARIVFRGEPSGLGLKNFWSKLFIIIARNAFSFIFY